MISDLYINRLTYDILGGDEPSGTCCVFSTDTKSQMLRKVKSHKVKELVGAQLDRDVYINL